MRIRCVQNIIDKIRFKKKVKFSCPEFLPTMYYKIETLKKLKNIETLVLGSSHGEYGFIANKPKEYNLSASYQDLYYSYNLYKKFNTKELKNIILFYSVFSPGNQLIKTKYYHICSQYKILADIDYQCSEVLIDKDIDSIEKDNIVCINKLRKDIKINKSDRGNCLSYAFPCRTDNVQSRTIPHYKNNQRNNNQNKYLQLLIDEAQECNQKVIIVLSPATSEYKKELPSSKCLFKEVFDLIEENLYQNAKIINLYDMEFSKNLFGDWDHLNKDGAEIVSKIIRDQM